MAGLRVAPLCAVALVFAGTIFIDAEDSIDAFRIGVAQAAPTVARHLTVDGAAHYRLTGVRVRKAVPDGKMPPRSVTIRDPNRAPAVNRREITIPVPRRNSYGSDLTIPFVGVERPRGDTARPGKNAPASGRGRALSVVVPVPPCSIGTPSGASTCIIEMPGSAVSNKSTKKSARRRTVRPGPSQRKSTRAKPARAKSTATGRVATKTGEAGQVSGEQKRKSTATQGKPTRSSKLVRARPSARQRKIAKRQAEPRWREVNPSDQGIEGPISGKRVASVPLIGVAEPANGKPVTAGSPVSMSSLLASSKARLLKKRGKVKSDVDDGAADLDRLGDVAQRWAVPVSHPSLQRLEMTVETTNALREFLTDRRAGTFAVSADGRRHSIVWCKKASRCPPEATMEVIQRCIRLGSGTCHVYSTKKRRG